MHLECSGLYLVLLALAVACIGVGFLPTRGGTHTVAAAGCIVLGVLAALLALLC